jgi:hypothetical protein
MLLITSPAGHGKTALVNELARHGPDSGLTVHATHHCVERQPTSTDPVRVFARIAGQLVHRVPGYGAVVGDLGLVERGGGTDAALSARAAVLDSPTPEIAFTRALKEPFGVLASTGRLAQDVVLVVDGLDECAPVRSSILTQLLAGEPDGPAVPHLRVIATSRPTTGAPTTSAPTTDRAQARSSRVSSFDLTADCPDVTRDVKVFLARTHLARRDVSALVSAAGGSLLYADLAVRMDRAGAYEARQWGELPAGLNGLYDALLGTTKPLARTVLALLARSRGDGLRPRQLTRLLDASWSDVDDVLAHCSPVVQGSNRRRTHHRCLGDYLAATMGIPATSDLDWLIAERLLRDGIGRWRGTDGYGLRNVLIHLAHVAAGASRPERRRAAATAIAATVNEPGYLTAALGSIGVDDLLSGLGYVVDRAPTLAGDVARTAGVLRSQGTVLRQAWATRDHGLITQQLVYEAATVGATKIGRALVDRIGGAGILTLWATVNSPDRVAPDARPGHQQDVDDASILPDGERGVTSSRDGVFRVWQLASGQLLHEIDTERWLRRLHDLSDYLNVVTAQPDGGADAMNATRRPIPMDGAGQMSTFAVDRNSTRGISGDSDGNATVWDLEHLSPMVRLRCRADLVTAVDISGDGWLAATGSIAGEVMLWDVPTGVPVHRFTCPGVISALGIAPCGTRIIVGDHESVSVYAIPDVPAPVPVARLSTGSRVTALTVNPGMPSYVLCGTASGQVMYLRLP